MSNALVILYTNWKGETRVRTILPSHVWYGRTEWHSTPQWLLTAIDLEDNSTIKDFALSGFKGVPPPDAEAVE